MIVFVVIKYVLADVIDDQQQQQQQVAIQLDVANIIIIIIIVILMTIDRLMSSCNTIGCYYYHYFEASAII